MSRRFQIITAQVEAARRVEQERRAKFSDKAAMYAVGADDFCRKPQVHMRQEEQDAVRRALHRSVKFLDAPINGTARDIRFDGIDDTTTPTPWAPPTWRTATKQWHKGPPPHDGSWLCSRKCEPLVRRFSHGHWYSAHDKGRRLNLGDFQWHGYAPDAEGWIKWDGGECPVSASTLVQLIVDDIRVDTCSAGLWGWSSSILAYRVVK